MRWLQLQVVSSGVALTRKQPAELQPPPPPQEKDENMSARVAILALDSTLSAAHHSERNPRMHRRPPGGAENRDVLLGNKHSSPGRTETAHLCRVDVPDDELDALSQVAD